MGFVTTDVLSHNTNNAYLIGQVLPLWFNSDFVKKFQIFFVG